MPSEIALYILNQKRDALADIEARTDLPEMERRVLQVRTMVRAQQKLDREREAAERENRRQVVAKERDLEQEIRGADATTAWVLLVGGYDVRAVTGEPYRPAYSLSAGDI